MELSLTASEIAVITIPLTVGYLARLLFAENTDSDLTEVGGSILESHESRSDYVEGRLGFRPPPRRPLK